LETIKNKRNTDSADYRGFGGRVSNTFESMVKGASMTKTSDSSSFSKNLLPTALYAATDS
jgi:hypothetical protein